MQKEAARGTRLHAIAAELISLKIKLPANGTTLSMYVNDAIGYGMRPEQALVYSHNAFGAVDAIAFKKRLLRIHDLKNGQAATSFKQLEIYAALFCLEYMEKPFDIKMELRIYQNDNVKILVPDPDDIQHHIERIKYLDKRIDLLEEEEDYL